MRPSLALMTQVQPTPAAAWVSTPAPMGKALRRTQDVDGCHTRYLLEVHHCAIVYAAYSVYSASMFSHRIFCLADGLTSSRARNVSSTSLISLSGSWGKSEA